MLLRTAEKEAKTTAYDMINTVYIYNYFTHMIEIPVACALFTAPVWANIYLWITSGTDGFVVESLACAFLAVILFMSCILVERGPITLPLHTATHATLAFGLTFSAVDIHRGDVYIRCAILLGFHAALIATFLFEPSKKEKESLLKEDI